jgi:hypothetical protein
MRSVPLVPVRRVAGHIAAGEPALIQHRDVGDAVVLDEIVRGRQAVPSPADDDDVICPFGLRIAPEEIGMIGKVRTRGLWTHADTEQSVITDISVVEQSMVR